MKKELRTLIAQGKTKMTIQKLLEISEGLGDEDLYNDVIFQSSKYEEYLKNKSRGILNNEELNIALARVNDALLEIIGKIPERIKVSSPSFPNLFKPLNLGLLALILVVTIIIFYQFDVILGIFTQQNRGKSLTVFVHGKNGKSDLILKSKGKVELTYGTKKARESINDKGQAVFNEIPGNFFEKDTKVYINVVETEGEPYQALNPDSLYKLTIGSPIYLAAALMGLEKITGTVYFNDQPLQGVTVSIGNLRTISNDLGYYELIIPDSLQKQQQKVLFYKEGFKLMESIVFPQTGASLPALMEKE